MLQTALANYTKLMDNDYDAKFNTYATSIVDNAPDTVHDFVYANGDKYFSCVVTETGKCCSGCKGQDPNTTPGCKYCFDGPCEKTCDSITPHCNKIKREAPGGGIGPVGGSRGPATRLSNHSEPCPPDFSQRDSNGGPENIQSVYWIFTDEALFWTDLFNGTAITKNETKIGNYDPGVDCPPKAAFNDPCWGEGMDFGIPMVDVSKYSIADVTNPKDIFTRALKNTTALSSQLDDALFQVQTYSYIGDESELIDAVSMPVFMIVEAVENMQAIETTAEAIDKAKREAIILGIIGAILFIIPVVGEVVGAAEGAATLGAIITTLGAAGDVAFNVWTIVDDPSNAPLAIFGLILAPLALSNLATITKAAQIRRGMSETTLANLGAKLSGRMGMVDKIVGVCKRLP